MCERTDLQFIQDILESTDAALSFVDGYDFARFAEDRKTKSAVIRELEIIGEASSRISSEKKHKYPDIPWRLLKDFRNVLSHEYFGVNEEIVWDIVTNKLPPLKTQIEEILAIESKQAESSQ
ncbi:MAG: DUF86 domain-containing protein [Desulfobacter sp.]